MKLRSAIERAARLQASRPLVFLGVALVLTLLSSVGLVELRFDSSFEALLPEDEPRIQNMNDVRSRTGGTRQVVVAVGGGDAAAREAFARELKPGLEEVEHVRFVDMEFPVEFFRERGLLMLDPPVLDELQEALQEAIRATKWFHNPMNPHLDEEQEKKDLEAAWKKVERIGDRETRDVPLSGVIESKDGKWVFMMVVPSIKFEDMEKGRRFNEAIRARVQKLDPESRGLHVRYAGNLEILQEQHAVLKSDLRLASVIALLFGIVIVAAFTRRPLAPLAVGLPLVTGIMWTFGIVGVTIGHVNIITGFLVAVLIGLGIDFGVHLFVRYQQERDRTDDPDEAMVSAVVNTFRPALASAGTTAATFFSFTLAEFRGFSEFGFIASLGVVLTLTSSLLVLPPLMLLVDRRRKQRSRGRPTLVSRVQGEISGRLCGIAVIVFVTLAVLGATRIPGLRFENDLRHLRGESPAYEFFDYVNRNMGMGFNPAVILVDDPGQAREVVREVQRMQDGPEGSRFGRVMAITDFLPVAPEEGMQRVQELRQMLSDPKLDRAEGERREKLEEAREMVRVEPWTAQDLPRPIQRRFTTLDGGQSIVYLWPDRPNYAADQVTVWENQIQELTGRLKGRGIELEMAEETLIVGWIHRLIKHEAPELLVIAALVVLLILILDLRRVRDGVLVATPLVVGMLLFVTLMWATGQELNLFNIIVVPSIIGIGIDNSVHIFHRYQSAGRSSVVKAMVGTGVAALLASLTTAVGFGSSMVSHITGLRSMGVLAMTGIGATFLAAVIFFPCLLSILDMVRSRTRPGNG